MFEVVCVGGWGGSVGDKKEIESGAVWMCVVGGLCWGWRCGMDV